MRKVTLTRSESSDEGTFGTLITDSGFTCFTGELSDGCLPAGIYQCSWRESSRHGMCFHIDNMPDRIDVEIHVGNHMGSASKKNNLNAAIALGTEIGDHEGQKALLYCRKALEGFHKDMRNEGFELEIIAPPVAVSEEKIANEKEAPKGSLGQAASAEVAAQAEEAPDASEKIVAQVEPRDAARNEGKPKKRRPLF